MKMATQEQFNLRSKCHSSDIVNYQNKESSQAIIYQHSQFVNFENCGTFEINVEYTGFQFIHGRALHEIQV